MQFLTRFALRGSLGLVGRAVVQYQTCACRSGSSRFETLDHSTNKLVLTHLGPWVNTKGPSASGMPP